MRRRFPAAVALAAAFALSPARAQELRPLDAQDAGFARATRERAPDRLWQTELERDAYMGHRSMIGKPQRRTGYRGLVVPGDGRALVAFFARETVDILDGPVTPGTESLFFRVLDGSGRAGARLSIAAAPELGMVVDAGNGAAAVLGAFRDGAVPLFLLRADKPAPRRVSLALPFKPLRFEAHGAGFLVWLDFGPERAAEKRPFHLVRLDALGREVWRFRHKRESYGFLAAAHRADGATLAVLNDGPLDGVVAPIASLLLDPAGKPVARHRLDLSGEGGPVPTNLYALRGGGFLLTGFWWGPGGNFVAWLDGEGRLRRYAETKLGDQDEVHLLLPLADRGFLGVGEKGALIRFDAGAKPLWRRARDPADPLEIYELRALAGNGLLLAGARGAYEGGGETAPYVTRVFVERYRWE